MQYTTMGIEIAANRARTWIQPLQAAGTPLLLPDTSAMAVAHGRFLDWTTAGKPRHRGYRALTEAVRQAAARRTTAGAQAVDRRVHVDPAPLIAAQLAVWALGDGEDYDVLNSIR